MTKEEAKAKLRKAESDLRMANVVSEMHEQGVQEIKDEIAKLEAVIKKKDDWMEKLVDPKKDKHFYISADITSRYGVDWLKPAECKKNVALLFREESHAKIMANKIQLMQEMHAFAHVKNEGWMPDWGTDWKDENQKWGLSYDAWGVLQIYVNTGCNDFIFGIAVKSKEIAEEMLEIFGERIEKFYNKMY